MIWSPPKTYILLLTEATDGDALGSSIGGKTHQQPVLKLYRSTLDKTSLFLFVPPMTYRQSSWTKHPIWDLGTNILAWVLHSPVAWKFGWKSWRISDDLNDNLDNRCWNNYNTKVRQYFHLSSLLDYTKQVLACDALCEYSHQQDIWVHRRQQYPLKTLAPPFFRQYSICWISKNVSLITIFKTLYISNWYKV